MHLRIRHAFAIVSLTGLLALAACGSDAAGPGGPAGSTAPASTVPASTAPASTAPASTVPVSTVPGSTASAVDDSHLPVGDQQYTDTPTRGAVMACRTQNGTAGAQAAGPWFNGDGTWDLTTKIFVQGSVMWDEARATFTVAGDQRVISSNGLPVDAVTGVFPVAADDPAAAYDRNPNTIAPQTLSFSIPVAPEVAASASCIGGEIGVAINGVPIFNAFDAGGRDAGAWEVQDTCQGHPQNTGQYHYHSISTCLDTPGVNPSPLVGYAFDGFGIYGSRDADGNQVHDGDLDECHGVTSEVMWEGQMVTMYHYVATHEFPYTVGCFRGTATAGGGGG